jgi:hypothetical protein
MLATRRTAKTPDVGCKNSGEINGDTKESQFVNI